MFVRDRGVFRECKVWLKFYHCNLCAVRAIVLYMTVIYRDSIVFRHINETMIWNMEHMQSLRIFDLFQQIPLTNPPECIRQISHNAPFCNKNVQVCAHFRYEMVHCGTWGWGIVGAKYKTMAWVSWFNYILQMSFEINFQNWNNFVLMMVAMRCARFAIMVNPHLAGWRLCSLSVRAFTWTMIAKLYDIMYDMQCFYRVSHSRNQCRSFSFGLVATPWDNPFGVLEYQGQVLQSLVSDSLYNGIHMSIVASSLYSVHYPTLNYQIVILCAYLWNVKFVSCFVANGHYSDVIMSAMTPRITGISIVYPAVCSGTD